MSSIFSKNVENYLLATSALLEGADQIIVEVVNCSKYELRENVYHDNWDGGIDYHRLTLYVPLVVFKKIKDQVNEVEKKICQTIQQISRDVECEGLNSVTILPEGMTTENEKASLSINGMDFVKAKGSSSYHGIDVFISHLAKYKSEAHELKCKLKSFGVSAFVAHEDIEPTKEWQEEIENALRNARSLVALLRPGFQESDWCAQEIGFAYARGIKIIPVIQGVVPYGFIRKIQGLKFDSQFWWWEVYKRLPLFENEHEAFFYALANTTSFNSSVELAKVIQFLTPLSSEEVEKLFQLSIQNNKIQDSYTFWERTTHSVGMFEYLRMWTGIEYELIKNNKGNKYVPKTDGK